MRLSKTASAATAAVAVTAALTLAADSTVADAPHHHPGHDRAGYHGEFGRPHLPGRVHTSDADRAIRPAAQRAPQAKPKPASRQQLTENAHTLRYAGQVLRPVSELLTAVLHEDSGRLSARETDQRRAQIHRTLRTLRSASPARAVAPRTAADSTELVQRATDRLEKRIDSLLRTARDDDSAQTDKAADATLTSTMDLLAALVAGGNLPTATMPGLPTSGAEAQAKVPHAPGAQTGPSDQVGAEQARPLQS